jgi:hypothetical protein
MPSPASIFHGMMSVLHVMNLFDLQHTYVAGTHLEEVVTHLGASHTKRVAPG